MSYKIAIVKWDRNDGIAAAIGLTLAGLGHECIYFMYDGPVPAGVDIVFTFAPYNQLLQILRQITALPAGRRPFWVHWSTEGIPNLRLPWSAVRAIGAARSWIDRTASTLGLWPRLNRGLLRYRYVGDYYHAAARGQLGLLVDISAVYGALFNRHGLPAAVVPWGSYPDWHADLGLERDIDVLWFGARGSRRRLQLLTGLRAELRRRGIALYVVDNVERPFVFGAERTQLLNRAAITVNLLRTWYDDNLFRFPIVMANQSLVVSETLLPHCPRYEAGSHYVSAAPADLAATIEHYLTHEAARRQIVANAYQLVTEELTLERSLQAILALVAARMPAA